ncbi:MAG: SDR family oxidoreductase [Pseudomonadota bacterium]
MFSLRDRVALVTGASRGLGAEIALGLARAGAHVLLNSRDAGNLAPQIARIAAAGGHATALAFDVGDAAAIEQAFTAIEREHGRLDVLVSNVGTRKRGPLEALSRDDLSAMLAVNLTASFDMGKRAAALMAPRSHGRIIMVTSIAGPRARVGDAAYITAKGGLEAMTRAFAAELGPRGITVNAIAPGYFATLTNQYLVDDPAVQAYVAQRIPLQRWAAPHEIAGAAVFLASDEASYVNGHVLIVDGGHTTTF